MRLISFLGYDGSIYLMGWTGGYVLLALLLAPYLRKNAIARACINYQAIALVYLDCWTGCWTGC
ncbi:MAG: hypothetical protein ACR9NN_02775 [Nostochopsis sp.]